MDLLVSVVSVDFMEIVDQQDGLEIWVFLDTLV